MNSKTDIRELKSRHRLELLMRDTGERFEANGDEWRGVETPGLLVDLERQTWRIQRAGVETAGGDHFEWLKFRYGWNFGMSLRYLKSRPSDPEVRTVVPDKISRSVETVDDLGLEPIDELQQKALALAGDSIRDLFSSSYSSGEILRLLSIWPSRFLNIVDFSVDACSECGKEFDWQKPGTLCYLEQFLDYGGEDIDSDEAKIFFLDNNNLQGFVCDDCVQEKGRYYLAMRYCFFSAVNRESRERQRMVE